MSADVELKLTKKQRVFCESYAASGNGAAAARAAGYKLPDAIAFENLRKPKIQKYLEQLSKNADSKRIATFQERQEVLTKILRDEVKRIDPETGVEYGSQTKDIIKAVEVLGKMQGDFIERVHHECDVESKVNFYLPGNGRD